MPIYTYRCNNCEHQFDIRQRMSEDPLTTCPNCEGQIRRIVTSVGVVFKGSGFYVTDNRNGSSGKSTSKKETSDTKPTAESSVSTKESGEKAKPKTEAKSTS